MTHPTDEELDEMARDLSHTGELSMLYRCEIADAIAALRAKVAEANARADRAEAERAALMWAADQLNDHHILSAAVRTGYETPEDRIAALDRVAAAAVKSFCGARDETEALKMALRHAEDRIEAARSRIVMVRTQIEDRAAQGTAIRSA